MKKARDYRRHSWEMLKGTWGTAIAVSFLDYFVSGSFSLIFGGPMAVGSAACMLEILRNGKTKVKTVFNGFDNFLKTFLSYLLVSIYLTLWAFLLIVPGIIKSFSYAMTFFILSDHPEMKANEAIRESKKIMKGNKWRLFCLEFSFIGWDILVILTAGILALWVGPYKKLSRAAFYESIKN